MNAPRFLIISPVKDEARNILCTMDSVINQTVRPVRWIIVDDGSSDGTPGLIRPLAEKNGWITLILNERGAGRETGTAEAAAFKMGLEAARGEYYDYIVKLDGDVEMDPDYFERLLNEFEADRSLGIASGCYLERHGKDWETIEMPDYHAAGASKVLRKDCFEQIGGFLTQPGWDTVDEIKAHYLGWKTRHFKDIRFYHLRNEGSGMGQLDTNRMHGEIYYLTGGGKLFFTLKLIHRAASRPYIIGSAMLLLGYLKPMLLGRPLLVTGEEAAAYRRLLKGRMLRSLVNMFKKTTANKNVRDMRDIRP